MECSYYKEQFTLMLSGALNETQQKDFNKHLANCADCQTEFAEIQKVWDLMGEIPVPEPSYSMQTGFNAILRNFKKEQAINESPLTIFINRLKDQWQLQVRPRLAFGAAMIAIGLVSGYLLNRPAPTSIAYNKQIDSLSSQVVEMKQMMMLTLLQDPSASQRMLAVGYTEDIDKVDNKVIEALLTTLNEDPNVNVRLITLEALVKYAAEPKVREGLVQSLTLQESPLMQSAIADVMVQLQVKKSVQTMRKLLRKKDLNEMVKVKIEQSIHKLI